MAPSGCVCATLRSVALAWTLAALLGVVCRAELDADKAAELSREIREHFRQSGINWVSPKMLKDEIDLKTNVKPLMFVFTEKSCSDCRDLMEALKHEDRVLMSHLSAQFHCVLVLDDYNLEFGLDYAPKGNDYVPRIVFADPNGKVRPDLGNPQGDRTQPYMYSTTAEILDGMQAALESYRHSRGVDRYPADLLEDI